MKKVKKILSFSLVVFLAFSCQEKKDFKVTVDFSKSAKWDKNNAPESVTFLKEDAKNGKLSYSTLATVPLSEEGIAVFEGILEYPVYAKLSIDRIKGFRPSYNFALSAEDIHITFEGDAVDPKITGKYNIWVLENIKGDEKIVNAQKAVRESFKEAKALTMESRKALDNNNITLVKEIQPKLVAARENHENKRNEFTKTTHHLIESFLSTKNVSVIEKYLVYRMVNTSIPVEKYDEFITKAGEELDVNSPTYKSFSAICSARRKIPVTKNRFRIGAVYEDFTAQTLEGEEVKLSDFVKKGNYVFLDFWASWCAPCRADLPHVLNAYNKYKDKGFEVFSFSVDKKREAWEKASREEKLQWINTSNDVNAISDISKLYGIYKIPTSFLIDPNGKIVAKDLRGFDLEYELGEIFN